MNHRKFLAPGTVLILCTIPFAHASTASANEAPADRARAVFQQIESSAGNVAETAWRLENLARAGRSPESHLDGLDALKEDVNRIGSELRSLEAERASLTPWEGQALDRSVSLMTDIAKDADSAISAYNSGPDRLWSTSYPSLTEKIADDAQRVKHTISDYLKLAKARDQEQQMEHDLTPSAN